MLLASAGSRDSVGFAANRSVLLPMTMYDPSEPKATRVPEIVMILPHVKRWPSNIKSPLGVPVIFGSSAEPNIPLRLRTLLPIVRYVPSESGEILVPDYVIAPPGVSF